MPYKEYKEYVIRANTDINSYQAKCQTIIKQVYKQYVKDINPTDDTKPYIYGQVIHPMNSIHWNDSLTHLKVYLDNS